MHASVACAQLRVCEVLCHSYQTSVTTNIMIDITLQKIDPLTNEIRFLQTGSNINIEFKFRPAALAFARGRVSWNKYINSK